MGIATGIAIYLTVWWTTLFAVLPLGNRTYAESGIEVKDGGDPGAPVNPNLKRKFITTTWVAALIWCVIWLVIRFGLITLPSMPNS
ncbi:COG5454 Predicted secreted protein [Caulobacteraceae bacterium]|jgi:predicted secreted protein